MPQKERAAKLEKKETAQDAHELLAILDAGAQYGKVIDRRVRNLSVKSVFLPVRTPWEELKKYKGIIISGGPKSVYEEGAPQCDPRVFTENNGHIPVLGICYGMQLMNQTLGGKVERMKTRQDGPSSIQVQNSSVLFEGLTREEDVLMSHGDSVSIPPDGFKITAESEGLIAAIEDPGRKYYGVQFHPEMGLTRNGRGMLQKFLYDVCNYSGDFTIEDREQEAIQQIKEKVGEKPILLLLSGGVDSTVLAALMRKALPPDQIHALHIDNGYMRKDESKKVKEALEAIGLKLDVIDASRQFYEAIGDSTDPEFKRKQSGDVFINVAKQAMRDRGFEPEDMFLGMGTLRPDLIESASKLASGEADVIKTHHNDSPLAREFRDEGHVVEPLMDLHKDEVRALGEQLGLPSDLVWRQPFPGPGLVIRDIRTTLTHAEINPDLVTSLAAFSTDQISASVLPIKTVGVQGDARTYNHGVILSGEDNWKELMRMAREIPRKVHGVNRVVYVFGDKLIEQPTTLTPSDSGSIDQLREADDIVNQVLTKYDLLQKLSQVPVIITPVNFGEKGGRSITIRTFITDDFMDGVPAVPGSEYMPETALHEMVQRILSEVSGISRVMYDLTSKPPGTTEWE